jgi:hypothetical protein
VRAVVKKKGNGSTRERELGVYVSEIVREKDEAIKRKRKVMEGVKGKRML